jgi:hypothetical protein
MGYSRSVRTRAEFEGPVSGALIPSEAIAELHYCPPILVDMDDGLV